jgi:hypothetical protein
MNEKYNNQLFEYHVNNPFHIININSPMTMEGNKTLRMH